MKVRVVDIETTGLPEDGGRVCEIAWHDLALGILPGNPRSYLINPGCPMPPDVRAIHHIDPRELVGRPVPGWATHAVLEDIDPGDLLCAHGAKFEQHFIDAPAGVGWVDTFKCGLRAWRDAPSHSNQALRYYLGLDDKPEFDGSLAMPPHRALPDAYTTAFILRELLALRSAARLVEISAEPAFLLKIGFGKHRGVRFEAVPTDYLEWILTQDFEEDVIATASWHLDLRRRKGFAPASS